MEEKFEKEMVVVQVPRDLHEKLKIRGIQIRKTLKELVEAALAEWLMKNGEE